MDTLLAYALFDLPVKLMARALRRLTGLRLRRAEAIAVPLVAVLLGSMLLAALLAGRVQ
ncbi:MAG: hypothetical protein RJA44_1393 [Pseudomonadota bacterium]